MFFLNLLFNNGEYITRDTDGKKKKKKNDKVS